MNKSITTNVITLLILGVGYAGKHYGVFSPGLGDLLFSIGIFAFSGGITNWLAIYMLFEKIPFLYGSGIIPNRFEEFKLGIRTLLMEQFFTIENIERLMAEETKEILSTQHLAALSNEIDYNSLFDKLKKTILSSSMGGMLAMIGGDKMIDSFRQEALRSFRSGVEEELSRPDTLDKIQKILVSKNKEKPHPLLVQVGHVIDGRLDEFTPLMVKEIIQKMIRQHLGWLVVWGGVFGAFIGGLAQSLA